MTAWILATLVALALIVSSYRAGKHDAEIEMNGRLPSIVDLAAEMGASAAIGNTAHALSKISSGDSPLILSEIARNADVNDDEAVDVLNVIAALLREDYVVLDGSTVTFKVGA